LVPTESFIPTGKKPATTGQGITVGLPKAFGRTNRTLTKRFFGEIKWDKRNIEKKSRFHGGGWNQTNWPRD
jgi:hypothetical protein